MTKEEYNKDQIEKRTALIQDDVDTLYTEFKTGYVMSNITKGKFFTKMDNLIKFMKSSGMGDSIDGNEDINHIVTSLMFSIQKPKIKMCLELIMEVCRRYELNDIAWANYNRLNNDYKPTVIPMLPVDLQPAARLML